MKSRDIQPLLIHDKNIKANKLVGSCTVRYIKKELQLIDKNNSSRSSRNLDVS